ncbi:MAG: F0F1 ATP synthase subunit A [Bryobacterales bacterium]|nr:F0F1 ATP synthase subunit A [Bryobacterales bacterium]
MHELWFTALMNQFLAGPANALLNAFGQPAADPAKPWTNYMAMEVLVLALLVLIPLILRPMISVKKPGTLQQFFELIFEAIRGQAHDVIGHGSDKYIYLFLTLFVFILTSNLLGMIPTFEAPTMYPAVPLGCALLSFFYYNWAGITEQGVIGHLKHFAGPVWWLAWFMFPLEIISHCIRPMSLTIRLYANMFAGEEVTLSFLALVPLVIPVLVMLLHFFVSILQAFIFTVLTMVYVGGAVAHEDH